MDTKAIKTNLALKSVAMQMKNFVFDIWHVTFITKLVILQERFKMRQKSVVTLHYESLFRDRKMKDTITTLEFMMC